MASRALVSAPRSLHRSRKQILRWNTHRESRQSRPSGRPRHHAGRRGSRRVIGHRRQRAAPVVYRKRGNIVRGTSGHVREPARGIDCNAPGLGAGCKRLPRHRREPSAAGLFNGVGGNIVRAEVGYVNKLAATPGRAVRYPAVRRESSARWRYAYWRSGVRAGCEEHRETGRRQRSDEPPSLMHKTSQWRRTWPWARFQGDALI